MWIWNNMKKEENQQNGGVNINKKNLPLLAAKYETSLTITLVKQWEQTWNRYQIFTKRTGWFRRKKTTDKMSRMFHSSSCILFSSLESYLCSLKTEVSPRYIIRLTLNKGLFAFFLFVTILSILCPVGNRHPENSTGRVLNSHAVQRMESFARQYWTKADNNRRWLNYNGF